MKPIVATIALALFASPVAAETGSVDAPTRNAQQNGRLVVAGADGALTAFGSFLVQVQSAVEPLLTAYSQLSAEFASAAAAATASGSGEDRFEGVLRQIERAQGIARQAAAALRAIPMPDLGLLAGEFPGDLAPAAIVRDQLTAVEALAEVMNHLTLGIGALRRGDFAGAMQAISRFSDGMQAAYQQRIRFLTAQQQLASEDSAGFHLGRAEIAMLRGASNLLRIAAPAGLRARAGIARELETIAAELADARSRTAAAIAAETDELGVLAGLEETQLPEARRLIGSVQSAYGAVERYLIILDDWEVLFRDVAREASSEARLRAAIPAVAPRLRRLQERSGTAVLEMTQAMSSR